MFCPKCATENNEGAKFCRSCGSDISLVPQAMTGPLQTSPSEEEEGGACGLGSSRKRRKQPSLDSGFRNGFMGLAFVAIAIVLSYRREGTGWWYWLLIPGFMMIGGGVAEYLKWRSARTEIQIQSNQTQASINSVRQVSQLPPRRTNELVTPPPSVTEGTTRHLGAEGPTKVFATAERPKQEN